MIFISVVYWQNADDTIQCVESLVQLELDEDFKIVVVDNNSPDGSFAVLTHYFSSENTNIPSKVVEVSALAHGDENLCPETKLWLVQSGENKSYAGGNNWVLRSALNYDDVNYVWVLNNDVEVDIHALQSMKTKLNTNKKYGMCGSKLVYFDQRDQMQALAGGQFSKLLGTTCHYLANHDSSINYDEAKAESVIDYLVGASLLIRRNVIEKVGLLSEDYFLYYEELDYCERLKKQGFSLAVCRCS